MVRLVFLVSVGLLCFQMPAVLSFTRLLYADVFNSILQASDSDIIPLENEGSPVRVNLSLTLLEISEVDTENNQMEIVAWLETKWRNPAIVFYPSEKNNFTLIPSVSVPALYMWIPDLTVYNGVKKPEQISPNIALVSYDGSVLLALSQRMRFICDLQGVESSAGVTCRIKIGSWTYHGSQLDLSKPNVDLSNYIASPKYELMSATAEREVVYYACCPQPYVHVLFNITIRKKGVKKTGIYSLFDWD